jgi:hypothetical protein
MASRKRATGAKTSCVEGLVSTPFVMLWWGRSASKSTFASCCRRKSASTIIAVGHCQFVVGYAGYVASYVDIPFNCCVDRSKPKKCASPSCLAMIAELECSAGGKKWHGDTVICQELICSRWRVNQPQVSRMGCGARELGPAWRRVFCRFGDLQKRGSG